MSDSQEVSARTQATLLDLSVRSVLKQQAETAAAAISDSGIHMARVVAVNAFGDVQIDILSDGTTGEWLTPLNRHIVQIGDGVAYTYVSGSPFVLGPIMGDGSSLLLCRGQSVFDDTELDLEDVDSEFNNSQYLPMLHVDQENDFIRTAVGFYRDPLVHVWDEHWDNSAPTFEDGGDFGSSSDLTGSSSAPTSIQLHTAATSNNVRFARLSAGRWLNPMDDFDILMRAAVSSSSNVEYYLGLTNDPTSPPGATGVFFRATSGGANLLTSVIRIDNSEIDVHAFSTVIDDYQTMRIFSRHFPEATDAAQRRITFQILAGVKLQETQSVDKDYNLTNETGQWNVKEEYSFDLAWSGLVINRYQTVAAAVKTTANSAKILRVDYIKGWSRMESQRQSSLAK